MILPQLLDSPLISTIQLESDELQHSLLCSIPTFFSSLETLNV